MAQYQNPAAYYPTAVQHYAPHTTHPYRSNPYPLAVTSTEFNPEWRETQPDWIQLSIRQQPKQGLVTPDGKEKARKSIDPPPIVEMKMNSANDPAQHFLQSPYFFMTCSLVDQHHQPSPGALIGMVTSSLHRLKDISNKDQLLIDGGFFVFGDLSAKKAGIFKLHFALFDLRGIKDGNNPRATFLKEILSEPFSMLSSKEFKGMDESTYLSRAFADQGVRLRLRKEPRVAFSKKRGIEYDAVQQPASQEFEQEEETAVEDRVVKRQRYQESSEPYQYSSYSGSYSQTQPHTQAPPHSQDSYNGKFLGGPNFGYTYRLG